MMGDWILEYGNVNLVGLYFTEQIYSYKYVLDVPNIPNIPNISQCIYGGMTFSILSRIVFIVLLYINKSKKILSCTVCGLNVLSNSFWIPYAFSISSKPLMIRSVMDLSLSFFGMSYILYNRYGSSLVQSVCPSKETSVDRDKQHTHRIVQEDGGIGSRI